MRRIHFRLTSGMISIVAVSFVAALYLVSCTSAPHTESDQQLRQKSAQATQQLKQQSKDALADARVAAAKAERKVNAIAAGVKDGMRSGGSAGASAPVNINTASVSELDSLPGISEAKARQIVTHRPYSGAHQLVDRGLLTQSQYDAVAPRIVAP